MSVRVLCAGDFQLGKSFSTLGRGAKIFREQLMTTFTDIIGTQGQEYDLILIAGDLFDRAATPTSIIEQVADILAKSQIPCVILPGNHDAVNTGIPNVLAEALAQRGATHVLVPIERAPIAFEELGITLYPAPLFRRDDLSDQYGWIPEREKTDGTRIALMHGALSSIPNGQIPDDLASQKDLDVVICGDQHGPKGTVEASNLFNLDTSKERLLYYAMAPEPMHINQNFVGSYLSLTMDSNGKIVEHERFDVGKLRFFNEVFDFESQSNELFDDFLVLLEDYIEKTTSVRITLRGSIPIEKYESILEQIRKLSGQFDLFDVINDLTITESEEESHEPTELNAIVRSITSALDSDQNVDAALKNRVLELLKVNLGRWA